MSGFPSTSDRKLGYQKNLSRRQARWTEEDVEILTERFGLITDAWLARILGRTKKAIRVKAQRLKLYRTANFYTATDVARIFGVNHSHIVRWIAAGLISARKINKGAGKGSPWVITQEAVEAFIQQYPAKYDHRRIDWVTNRYYRDLANLYVDSSNRTRSGLSWTFEEETFLINNYRRRSYTELAAVLRRTEHAVDTKVQELRRRGNFMPSKTPGRPCKSRKAPTSTRKPSRISTREASGRGDKAA
ncbi:MAG TPA: helix-turn-helix domain-containing protein [Chloroflexia bacterium]|jgi:hypothetical protein